MGDSETGVLKGTGAKKEIQEYSRSREGRERIEIARRKGKGKEKEDRERDSKRDKEVRYELKGGE